MKNQSGNVVRPAVAFTVFAGKSPGGARGGFGYRSPDDAYFCTDGLCTHEQAHLAEGLVMGYIIECPMHNGRFDYRSGEAKRAPVCENLSTYPTRVEAGRVMIRVADIRNRLQDRQQVEKGTKDE